jgi:peptidylprolyl isomerase
MKQAQENDKVKVHYKGTLPSGEIFDSSEGRPPFEFTIGANEVIPGFENAVKGMSIGETKTVTIPSDEAYGPVRPELIVEIDRGQLADDIEPQVGMTLQTTSPDGEQLIFRIADIQEEKIILDMNHPLAGENLTFEITLESIE